ncbi:Pol [Symbiodinium sp. CCMP2592]|nr:Pol [Symbiodinium sp. CCMP2592]
MWDDDHWCFVHHSSGAPKEAGLLTCISKRLATPEGIRHSSIIAGRLQHLRITPKAGHQPIDLLHAYQFAWHHRKQDSKNDWWQDAMRRRAQFLQKLCSSVRSLPRRNLLCITGDLNTQLASCKGVVGLGIPSTPPPQQDGQDLLHTLCTYGLVATNTFGQAPGATFVNPATNAQTLIDYIILRGAHADGTSLASGPVQDWPVAMGRLGSRHIPVRGSFPFTWCPWVHSRSKQLTLKPRSVWEAVRNDPARQQAFRDKLRVTLPQQPTIADIDRCLTQAWIHSQPAGARGTLAPAGTAATVSAEATAVRALWQLRNERDALTHRPPVYCLRAAFAAWRLDHQIRALERKIVAERRARKKAFLLEQTALAERAAQQGQMSALYRVVNRLAPRKVRARLQIRDPEGNLQDPQAECDTLLQYFRDLFASSKACPTQVFDCSVQLFDSSMCTAALESLSALKAAHPSASPGVLWKLAAQEVGPVLSDCLNAAFSNVPHMLPLPIRSMIAAGMRDAMIPEPIVQQVPTRQKYSPFMLTI